MDKDEERKYVEEYLETKDQKILSILLDSQINLIQQMARKYTKVPDSLQDLINVGVIGFIEGLNRMDLSKDLRLSTYACSCADFKIKDYLKRESDMFAMGKKSNDFSKILTRIRKLNIYDWSQGDVEKFALQHGVDAYDVLTILQTRNHAISSVDYMANEIFATFDTPEEYVFNKELTDKLDKILGDLTERERDIFLATRLDYDTVKNLAKVYNLNERSVRVYGLTIEKKILAQLGEFK